MLLRKTKKLPMPVRTVYNHSSNIGAGNYFMTILKKIKSLCSLSRRYSLSKKAFTPSNGEGVFIIQYLEDLAKILMQRKSVASDNLEILISKGRGNIPKVFWISVVPRGFSPSDSLSVTICFGRNGDGIVAGLMVPKLGGFHNLKTVLRSGDSIINIDGDKDAVKYNDCYINPIEIRIDDFSEDILLNHIDHSVSMLNAMIKTGSNEYRNLYIN